MVRLIKEGTQPKKERVLSTSKLGRYSVEELEGGKFRLTLDKGFQAIFRRPTLSDIVGAEKADNEASQARRLAASCCLKWGSNPSIAEPELEKIRAKEHNALSTFFGRLANEEVELQTTENEDYSLIITFPDGFELVLRDAKSSDIEALQPHMKKIQNQESLGSSLESFAAITLILCSRWGSESAPTMENLRGWPASNLLAVSKLITANFLGFA